MRNVPTELVLLQIAEGLKSLVENPDLSQIIKDAYSLSESEKAKADEARQLISEADSIRAELKKKEDDLLVINGRIKDAEKLEAFNADTLADIKARERALSGEKEANRILAEKTMQEKKRLDAFSASLLEQAQEQKALQKELDDMRKKLNEKIAKIQAEVAA